MVKKKIKAISKKSTKNKEKSHSRLGRPSILTDEVVGKLVYAIGIGASYELSAIHAGVSYPTLRNWIRLGKAARDKNENFPETLSDSEKEYLTFLTAVEQANGEAGIAWQNTVNIHARKDPVYALQMLRLRFTGYNEKAPVNFNFSVDLSKHNLSEYQMNYIATGQVTNEQAERIASGENPAIVIPDADAGSGSSGTSATAKPKPETNK
jgi:hypothetical protein